MGMFSGFKMPKISISNIKLSDLGLPKLDASSIKMPDISLSDIGLPDPASIQLKLPELSLKDLGLPDLNSFKPDLSNIDLSKFGLSFNSFSIGNIFGAVKSLKNGNVLGALSSFIDFDPKSLLGNIGLDSIMSNVKMPSLDSMMGKYGISKDLLSDMNLSGLSSMFPGASFPDMNSIMSGSLSMDSFSSMMDFPDLNADIPNLKIKMPKVNFDL